MMIKRGPSIYPFYITAYGNDMVPDPRVAAISENTDPEVPPALNFL